MPSFFSEGQKSLVTAMLDRLIPRQGEHPGAGEIGVADYLDGAVSESSQLRRLFSDGLNTVQAAASAHGPRFEDLDSDTQDEVLRKIEADHSEFFERLVMLTYNGYYINPPDRARISWTGGQAPAAKGLRRGGRRPKLAGSRRSEGTGVQGRLRHGQSVDILSLTSLSRLSRLRCRRAIVMSPRVRSITPRITSVVRRRPRVTASG